MEQAGQSKFQTRIQGLLKSIKPEQIRTQVAGWQKLIATASAKLNTNNPFGKASRKVEETGVVVGTDSRKTEYVPYSQVPSGSYSNSNLEEDPDDKEDDLNDQENSSSDSRDTCVMVVKKPVDSSNGLATPIDKMESDPEASNKKLDLLAPATTSPRSRSPVTVQQWVDSLPIEENGQREEEMPSETEAIDAEVENLTLGAEAVGLSRPCPPQVHITSCGPWPGASSDTGSHCSSMESLLEARKQDPEELLMELGFGGSETPDILQRIPARFLQPSQMKGVAIDEFLRHQQHMADTFESGFSGYRGLQGPSHSKPSGIVGKIMERLVDRGGGGAGAPRHHASPRFANIAHNLLNKLRVVRESVLNPDNRRWLESQGDKSPENRGRRLIIGQRSFSLSKEGHIIESPNMSKSPSPIPILHKEEVKENKDEEKDEGKSESDDDDGDEDEDLSPKRTFEAEQLEVEYKSLALLTAQLKASNVPTELVTRDKFLSLTAEERRSLEVGLIERALATYEKRLKELDVRSHVEELLTGQLNYVTHLLDASSSPSLLSVVTQMTKLLRHQDSLREELKMHEAGVTQSV